MAELADAMAISASGLKAQGTRIRVLSENMANSSTLAAAPGEEPYRRKTVTFKNVLDRETGINKVVVDKIVPDMSDFKTQYRPGHPAADENGYVLAPNMNSLIEAMDMREAQRSYEANINAIEMSKRMLSRTVEMLR